MRLTDQAKMLATMLMFPMASPSTAQLPDSTVRRGEIVGRVVNNVTHLPIVGATVSVAGTASVTESKADGAFRLIDIPAGIRSVQARAIGFSPILVADVVVSPGRPATLTLELTPSRVELQDIGTEPTYFPPAQAQQSSTQQLQAEEIRRAPGNQEDVLRSIALLPGVGVTSAARNDLVVRGGAPFENLFLIDQIAVPDLNHFGSQGSTGGPVSLINLDLVQQVEFSAGGFGAKYGERSGSVTSLALREGNPTRLSGKATLSATGFGLSADGPLGKGTTAIGSVRRSYLDLLFSLAGFSFLPSYWETNLKVTHRISDRDRLSWLLVGTIDQIEFKNRNADDQRDNSRIPGLNQNQYVTGLSWNHSSAQSLLTASLSRSWTRFDNFQRDSLLANLLTNRSTEGSNRLALDYTNALRNGLALHVGGSATFYDALAYDVTLRGDQRRDAFGEPMPLSVDTSFTALRSGGYLELTNQWTPAFSVTVGGRLDHYGDLNSLQVAPRVAATLAFSPSTTMTLSGGQYWQGPSFIWLVGDRSNVDSLRPFRVDAAVVGLQRLLRSDLKVQVEGYYKKFSRYPTRVFRPQSVLAPTGFGDVRTDIPFGLEPLTSHGVGQSMGAELFVQKRMSTTPIYGLASVSVSRTRFTALDGIERPGAFDARIIGNLVLGWRPNPTWEFGGRFRVSTGTPTTPYLVNGPRIGELDFSQYNAGPRTPLFHAMDLRIDRRWSWRRSQLVTYLDVQNIYNRKNSAGYVWDDKLQRVMRDESLGLLPSIGISIEW